jgi:hypothetical protein
VGVVSRRSSPLLLAIALLLLVSGAAEGGTPEQDLASLNALRARNSIPAGITLNPEWSARCGQHVTYMRQTNTVDHVEDPASPWYTDGGNWAAGHAVLAAGITWTPNVFLWETAPLHLAQLLAPQLSEIGIADDDQFVCATTWTGYLRATPATNSVVTYPGIGTSIYASQETAEWPITPAQALGIPNPTGPHLYVYQWGPATVAGTSAGGEPITIRSATLTGPAGRLPLRWVDAATPRIGPYLPAASGILIPVRPLVDNARYTAGVTFSNGVSYAWPFTTALSDTVATLKDIRIVPQRIRQRRVCVRRRDGVCVERRTIYDNTIAVTGTFTSAADPRVAIAGADVGITFQKTQQAQLATSAAGVFRATYRFTSRTRRFRMRVTITAGSDTGAYIVRFRIVNRPSGLVAVVYGISPAPMTSAAAPPRDVDIGVR